LLNNYRGNTITFSGHRKSYWKVYGKSIGQRDGKGTTTFG